MIKRTWTTVGTELAGNALEDGSSIVREAVVRAIDNLDWQAIPPGGKLSAPFMPGEGIKAAIRQLRIPKVSHVAWSNELAPYGFYGIRGHYSNGDAEVYIADLGTHLVPVCSDFHEHEVFETVPNAVQP